jgi:hypothetical protein
LCTTVAIAGQETDCAVEQVRIAYARLATTRRPRGCVCLKILCNLRVDDTMARSILSPRASAKLPVLVRQQSGSGVFAACGLIGSYAFARRVHSNLISMKPVDTSPIACSACDAVPDQKSQLVGL